MHPHVCMSMCIVWVSCIVHVYVMCVCVLYIHVCGCSMCVLCVDVVCVCCVWMLYVCAVHGWPVFVRIGSLCVGFFPTTHLHNHAPDIPTL